MCALNSPSKNVTDTGQHAGVACKAWYEQHGSTKVHPWFLWAQPHSRDVMGTFRHSRARVGCPTWERHIWIALMQKIDPLNAPLR
eukprot:scaffold776_cov347-Pavlova_lutheri.AAC.17